MAAFTKRIILFVLSVLMVFQVAAKPRLDNEAIRVAFDFVSKEKKIGVEDISVVYAQKLRHFEHNAFYVCAVRDTGFVVVSGDDVAIPILAYSFENTISKEIPENVAAYLNDLAEEIDDTLLRGVKSTTRTSALNEFSNSDNILPASVTPMLTTTWDQGMYYNEMCPSTTTYTSSRGNHVWVGCEAVAMAQIIKYWSYPTQPRGYHEYVSPFGLLSVDFDDVTYNYGIMSNVLTSSSSAESKQEVQKLLYHCGVALDMKYGESGSGAYNDDARASLISYFKYSPDIIIALRSRYADSTWKRMLKEELANGRPVLYSGRNDSSGHAFVCDGYNSDGQFHFNFGWSGSYDGFYSLSALTPGTHNYSNDQAAIMGIVPDQSSRTYLSQQTGKSIYKVSDTIEVFDISSTNNGLYPYYYSSHKHICTFEPSDPSKKLALKPILNDTRLISVVDSYEDTSILNVGWDSASITSNTYYADAFTIVDTLSISANYGFKIFIDDGCRKVTNVESLMSHDTIYISWHENGEGFYWQIEYGPTGFEIGQGIRIGTYETMIPITNLSTNEEYDLYVRSKCSISGVNDDYGEWSEKITISYASPYWKDHIVDTPNGFEIYGDGNIEISTKEGLAWLISYVNGLNGQIANNLYGKTVRLTADIDLSPYNWTAINGFAGTFDGDDHIISNLYVSENTDYQGLFRRIYNSNAVIKNTHIDNAEIKGGNYVGSMCGYFSGKMINCTSTATINGQYVVGGLIGNAASATIDNCHAAGITSAQGDNCGGLIGKLTGIVSNSSSNSLVEAPDGSTKMGGLIGSAFSDCYILNSYSLCTIANYYARLSNEGSYNEGQLSLSSIRYAGGIVGEISACSNARITNCYSDITIDYDGNLSWLFGDIGDYVGSIVGNMGDTLTRITLSHCYKGSYELPFITTENSIAIDSSTRFTHDGYSNDLYISMQIDDSVCTDLLAALNMYVKQSMDTSLMLWTTGTDGYPIHSEYNTICPAVTNISVDVINTGDAIVTWENSGSAWQIEYGEIDSDNELNATLYTTSPSITINDLTSGKYYKIKIRSVCPDGGHGQWMLHTFRYCKDVNIVDTVTVCDSYLWRGQEYTWSIVVSDTLEAFNGCDSITTLNLTINNPVHVSVSETACETYQWHSMLYDSTGKYTFQHFDINGCEQVDTLNLTINHNSFGDETVTICNSFEWHGQSFISNTDTATYVCVNSVGCDSITTLHLTVNYCSYTVVNACDHYVWNGIDYTSSGIYIHENDTLDLSISNSVVGDTSIVACDNFMWAGVDYTASIDTLITGFVNVGGCDSSFYLHLAIKHSVTTHDTVIAAVQDIPYIYNGTLITEEGDYLYAFTAINGCDSLAGLHLEVDSSLSENYTYWTDEVTTQPDGFVIGEDWNVYISSKEGLAWLISVCNGLNGANSLSYQTKRIVLMADVDMSEHLWTPISHLRKTFDGRNHIIAGITIREDSLYNVGFVGNNNDTIRNVVFVDCDIRRHKTYGSMGCVAGLNWGSIVNCGVSGVLVSDADNLGGITGDNWGEVKNCYSVADVYGQRYVGGAVGRSASNTYHDYGTIIQNCYSAGIVTFNNPYSWSAPYAGAFVGHANDTNHLAYWLNQGTSIAGSGNDVSGFWQFVFGGPEGNYSVWNLEFPISVGGQTVSTLIDALNAWVDSNNIDGEYRRWTNDTTDSNHGFPVFEDVYYRVSLMCDDAMGAVAGSGRYVEESEVTISATANNCYHFVQWSDGNTNNTRTILVSQDISLTALFVQDEPSIGNVNVLECDTYIWNDNTYTESGIYLFGTTTAYGCDSIVRLNLTINRSDHSGIENITACNSYTWHGNTYYNSGVYTHNTTTTMGCDSTVTLNLTVVNEIILRDSVVACDSYERNGEIYSNGGTYAYSTTSEDGCDSTIILSLTINHSHVSCDTVSACDSYNWNGDTYTESGFYQHNDMTIAGCDSIASLHIMINHSENISFTEMVCDSMVWQNNLYKSSGTYTHTFFDENGCEQTDTLFLTVNGSTSAHANLRIWSSVLPYDYNGVLITGAGEYIITMTTIEGCDSIIYLNVTIVNEAGIESLDNEYDIEIYPNPTDGYINIMSCYHIDYVEIYNAVGRIVALKRNMNSMDIHFLPNGIYTMIIGTSQGKYVKKIVKN